MVTQKIIFLDRDGILNLDTNYPFKWNEVQPNSKITIPLKMGLEYGFKYIIITNQSGIGRELFKVKDYKKFIYLV